MIKLWKGMSSLIGLRPHDFNENMRKIEDASNQLESNLNTLQLPWSDITSKPTTLSGYGITDSIIGRVGGAVRTTAGWYRFCEISGSNIYQARGQLGYSLRITLRRHFNADSNEAYDIAYTAAYGSGNFQVLNSTVNVQKMTRVRAVVSTDTTKVFLEVYYNGGTENTLMAQVDGNIEACMVTKIDMTAVAESPADGTVFLNTALPPRHIGRGFYYTAAWISGGSAYIHPYLPAAEGATYLVTVKANPNSGSSAYRATVVALVNVSFGWSGTELTAYITTTVLGNYGSTNIGALTLQALFCDYNTYADGTRPYNSLHYIRFDVSGFYAPMTLEERAVECTVIRLN